MNWKDMVSAEAPEHQHSSSLLSASGLRTVDSGWHRFQIGSCPCSIL